MKMNKTKIIVPTLALAMGAALAGSVSGTVAWFQYSTRAQAAFIGASAHCSEALEIQATAKDAAVGANWSTELTSAQVATATGITAGTAVAPITSGAMDADDALPGTFYSNPIYQHFGYSEWVAATAANYYQFDLHFHVKDVNSGAAAYLAKALYLTDLSIVSLADDGTTVTDASNDLYKAVRVHIACGSSYLLFANSGAAGATVTTSVGEYLDLNNDGKFDTTAAYEWGTAGTQTIYGAAGNQVANNVKGFSFANDSNPASIVANDGLIGNITAANDGLKVTVTMWIEGWQGLATQATATGTDSAEDAQVWDPATYIGKKFGVGFRFACEAHTAH